ncbi:hypothetical protein LEP1GSC052_3731 [Leptospira kmetyi serovar Malaysia str. Bejo-Iso9]|nr:hypothetical protein LEP1GSC052_3731 [Leptospira kmetyi serovar Malaysia str. Bejo-Iso9]
MPGPLFASALDLLIKGAFYLRVRKIKKSEYSDFLKFYFLF